MMLPVMLKMLVVAAAFTAPWCAAESGPAAGHTSGPWKMHHIHNDYLIANSLDTGDVNRDGHDDYSVIDEWLGLQTIVFHPGPDGDVRKTWPRVVLGKTGNPEYSCLGDVDGDGNLDLIVVEGDDMEKGIPTGVRIWWGPTPDKVMDPAAWTNSGHMPGTEGEQYLFCLARDLNGDGRIEVLVGGRKHPLSKKYAGIRILSAPKDGNPRDLKRWTTRFVDPEALSGHGLVTADVNGNGLLDILNADADWDTPKFEQSLVWYENPGLGAGADKPWRKHVIWRSPAFYAKPQIAVGDLDGDGLADLATQTHNHIHLFRKTIAGGAVGWANGFGSGWVSLLARGDYVQTSTQANRTKRDVFACPIDQLGQPVAATPMPYFSSYKGLAYFWTANLPGGPAGQQMFNNTTPLRLTELDLPSMERMPWHNTQVYATGKAPRRFPLITEKHASSGGMTQDPWGFGYTQMPTESPHPQAKRASLMNDLSVERMELAFWHPEALPPVAFYFPGNGF